ncbi:hypothetical protein K402DRAFT_407735 [Aulographum hederae CBS 113979]|uniref:NTF2 domain-containing protein n=1 Tax=Aulographum hederae CBS 113979 TaxID=1176131 RepID=A0A6G1GN86_9PEZI|nr:hypothetical protein K402DRAFT_407735 [Aulographum hederae CBS 113979]
MSGLEEHERNKTATEAADDFCTSYYLALQNDRNSIASYFCAAETLPDGKTIPLVTWNGNVLTPAEYQEHYHLMPFTLFDVQVMDCHVLNPELTKGADTKLNFTIAVLVSGTVRLDENVGGESKGFSETLVLVPSKTKLKGKGRSWVIQSMNFRYVV